MYRELKKMCQTHKRVLVTYRGMDFSVNCRGIIFVHVNFRGILKQPAPDFSKSIITSKSKML
jgi:hypothetical protein